MLGPGFAQHVLGDAAAGFRSRVARAAFTAAAADEYHAAPSPVSMSARRFENALRMGLGTSLTSLRPLCCTCQRSPRGANSARNADR